MKQLDLPQVQKRLLGIAIAVDDICRKHEIPMYMIAGTMLGAVRHNGFIPWDDDMDFAVPYEQYKKLINVLHHELPANMKCVTFETSETYTIPWIKVEDTETMVFDNSLDLPKEKMPGLTIDIFPLASCDKSTSEAIIKRIQRMLKLQRVAYYKSPGNRVFRNTVKRIIRFFTPLSAKKISYRIMKLMGGIKTGNYYTIPVDPNYYGRYFPKEWFFPLTKYKFEECEFYGVADYESYLTNIYRDYMQLPPEEKRRVHCDNVYIK